ncbi:ran-specific GTPase-activating protein-like [Dysidea avara]|uniref:ran-specific GTPase-activating protein-like n=1 Tax=Dysidea avara TaxID=196820 RepID=UPI00331A6372
MRAKLFRFDTKEDPPEWKERGVGDMRILKHKKTGTYRIVMRREKTHKLCANHRLTADLKLLPSAGSDRAWVWTTQADLADEEAKPEQLAIRFANAESK